jgi:HD-GYP domain-containing protein (c-di-GMP phosphodiesterase class II)
MTKADAIAELRKCSGKQFDKNIVEIFINKVI